MDIGIFVRTIGEAHGADDAEVFNVEQGEAFASFVKELGYTDIAFQVLKLTPKGPELVNELHLWSFARFAREKGLRVHLWGEADNLSLIRCVSRMRECLGQLEGVSSIQVHLKGPFGAGLDRAMSYLHAEATGYGCKLGIGHAVDLHRADLRAIDRYADYILPRYEMRTIGRAPRQMKYVRECCDLPQEPVAFAYPSISDFKGWALGVAKAEKVSPERLWVWSAREAVLPLLNQAPEGALAKAKVIQKEILRIKRWV
jgi:hypothetical protein